MDPLLEEFCRSRPEGLRQAFVFRVQHHLKTVVLPKLKRLAELEAENAALKETLDGWVTERYGQNPGPLPKTIEEGMPDLTMKRGPGRPRKVSAPTEAA